MRDVASGRGDVGAWGEYRRRDGSRCARQTSGADLDDDIGRRFSATSNAQSNLAPLGDEALQLFFGLCAFACARRGREFGAKFSDAVVDG
jgi:hypothetical protein